MELFRRFFDEYATAFLYLCLTGLCTLLCNHLRHVILEKRRKKTIRRAIDLCTEAIAGKEQEKDTALLQEEAEEALLETLQSSGIVLSHVEARLLLRRESEKKQ